MRQSQWYIQIDGKREGPYSYQQLKDHPFVTPFTLAQKRIAIKGKKAKWRMMGQIAELKSLFQVTDSNKNRPEKLGRKGPFTDILVGSNNSNIPILLVWSVLALLAIIFVMFTYSSHGR